MPVTGGAAVSVFARMRVAVVLTVSSVAILLLGIGCGGEEVPYRRFPSTLEHGFPEPDSDEPFAAVATDVETFESWFFAPPESWSSAPEPIDFDTEVALFVAGRRCVVNWQFVVDRVVARGDKVIVHLTDYFCRSPYPGCFRRMEIGVIPSEYSDHTFRVREPWPLHPDPECRTP